MSTFRKGWYLIYTKPRHEKKVHTRLAELKIDSFLPLTKKLRNWHDRKKYVEEPLFPSYVFIYLKDVQNYYEGKEADGALCYVKTGKEIARVQDSIVKDIKLVADQAQDLETSSTRFHPGQRLVLNHGALTGLTCEVVQYNNKQKLLVRVDLLQRNILVTLPEEYLISL